jgi:ABC-type dipeptide/oligopeptide/nickel transport system ATPase component
MGGSGCGKSTMLRVAMRLIAISVGQVVSNDPAVAPHVEIGRTESGAGGVTISSGPQDGDQLLLEAAPRIGPMLPCAVAAARATQAHLERSADGRTIRIAWPLAED